MKEHGDSKDILGRTYEYCLSKFAEAEGKLAGEFFTPSCIVRTLVEVLCLLYTSSKQPVLAIETDGYAFHKSGTSQSERDIKKERILELYGIPLVRLSTIGSNEKKIIGDKLSEVLNLH